MKRNTVRILRVRRKLNFTLDPKNILKINVLLILFLLSANVLGLISKFYFDHGSVYGLIGLFDFNNEMNIPTFYS